MEKKQKITSFNHRKLLLCFAAIIIVMHSVNKKQRTKQIEIMTALRNLSLVDPEDQVFIPFASCDRLNITEPVLCGAKKCFIEEKNETNIGYLLGRDSLFDRMVQAYNYTKYLQDTYEIKHFLLDQPRQLPSLLPCLSLNIDKYSRKWNDPTSNKTRNFNEQRGFVIQKNRVAPTPNIILGTSKRKRNYFYAMMEPFLMNHVQNKTQFVYQLEKEISNTLLLLKQEPRLLSDFQVLIDVYGNLYHIDLDRCFEHWTIPDERLNDTQTLLQALLIQARSNI